MAGALDVVDIDRPFPGTVCHDLRPEHLMTALRRPDIYGLRAERNLCFHHAARSGLNLPNSGTGRSHYQFRSPETGIILNISCFSHSLLIPEKREHRPAGTVRAPHDGRLPYAPPPRTSEPSPGAFLIAEGSIGGLTVPEAVSFLSPQLGRVAGGSSYLATAVSATASSSPITRGRTWHVQYVSSAP